MIGIGWVISLVLRRVKVEDEAIGIFFFFFFFFFFLRNKTARIGCGRVQGSYRVLQGLKSGAAVTTVRPYTAAQLAGAGIWYGSDHGKTVYCSTTGWSRLDRRVATRLRWQRRVLEAARQIGSLRSGGGVRFWKRLSGRRVGARDKTQKLRVARGSA
jgi:hypothetical protein